MRHIIISDTHAPTTIEKAYQHVKNHVMQKIQTDAIVINGDLLGVFSMRSSNVHKGTQISQQEMMQYLQLCAPQFYTQLSQTGQITPAMVIQYVKERYEWCYATIKKFADMHKTYFNLGNHESKLHFLVLQEIPFLTGCNPALIQNVDSNALNHIYDEFERKLYELEKTNDFKYIRDTHDIVDGVLIMGIPGESHGTVGPSYEAQMQEKKTQELIAKVSADLHKVHTLIIYNHTQANYNRENGSFQAASPSLHQFMTHLPSHITQRIFIQSHNHWSYTQFLQNHGFKFVLNNAGLHDGIFNLIDFTEASMHCFDIDPNTKKAHKLNLATHHPPITHDVDTIGRFYENKYDIYLYRRLLVQNMGQSKVIR